MPYQDILFKNPYFDKRIKTIFKTSIMMSSTRFSMTLFIWQPPPFRLYTVLSDTAQEMILGFAHVFYSMMPKHIFQGSILIVKLYKIFNSYPKLL